jgi:hypothetical protein
VIKRWAGPVNGDWKTAENWSPPGVPATNDYVLVTAGSIVLSHSVTVAGTFSWSGGTIQRAFNVSTPVSLTVLSNCNWSGGTLANVALRVNAGGVLNIHGPIAGVALAAELVNAGTVNWLSGPIFGACSGFGPIVNLPGGVWDIRCDQPLNPCGLPAAAYFQNEGVFRKSASLGATEWGIPLINAGTVSILEGTFRHAGGGAIDGHYEVSSGASLEFASRPFRYTTTPIITGSGSAGLISGSLVLGDGLVPGLELKGGTVTLSDRFQGGAITNLTLGTGLTLAGSNHVLGVFACNGANVSGPLSVAGSGTVNWRGGTMSGPIHISPDGVLNIDTSTLVSLAGTLTNAGTVNWLSGAIFPACASFGPVVNLPGALWDVLCDQTFSGCGATATGYFENRGTLRKSRTTGFTEWGIPLRNSGTASVLRGTLRLNGGGVLEGNFDADMEAALHFNLGTFTCATPPKLAGSGAYRLTGGNLVLLEDVIPSLAINGGTITLGPLFQGGTITNLTLSAGTLAGTNRVSGTFEWGGTALAGHLLVQEGAVMNWRAGLAAGGLTIRSNGVVNVLTSGSVTSQGPVTNQGTLSIREGAVALQGGFAPTGGRLLFGLHSPGKFGRISVSGAATLDGALGVEWLNGFVPALGQSFPVVTYGSRTGTFTELTLPSRAQWRTDYGSTSFSVTVTGIDKLTFSADPVGTTAGRVLAPVVVQVQDPADNPISVSGAEVTLSLASGGGRLEGTLTRPTDAAGKATFDDLTLSSAGTMTLIATAPAAGLTPAISRSFVIAAGVPAQLVLASPISARVPAGVPFPTQPRLQVLDQFGNLANQTIVTITPRLSSGRGSLTGSASASGSGQIDFSNLRYQPLDPGTAETFVAYFEAPGLPPVTNPPVLAYLTATNIVLQDGNASVRIDPLSSRGVFSWTIDGIEQAHQQWLWLRAGTNVSQISLDRLGAPSVMSYRSSNVTLHYSIEGLELQAGFTLQGGTPASQSAKLSGTFVLLNPSPSPVPFHLYLYSDLDLGGHPDDDLLTRPSTNTLLQAGKNLRATTVHAPAADHWEGAHYGILSASLNEVSPLILSDELVPPAAGDQTYALQWDLLLNAQGSLTLAWTTHITPDQSSRPNSGSVIPSVRLKLLRRSDGLVLTWPAAKAAEGFELHAAEDLAGPWRPVTEVPRLEGEQYEVPLPLSWKGTYFRLVR